MNRDVMNREEYTDQLKAIFDKKWKDVELLNTRFATENNPHEIGEIAHDHIGKILISDMRLTTHQPFPSMIYIGLELKLDGTPKKKRQQREMYQCNLLDK